MIAFVDKIGSEHLLALEGLVGVAVVGFGHYHDIDLLSDQGRISVMQSKSILIDFPQPESLWVSDVEMSIFPIEIYLYVGTVMVDNVVGVEVGPWSFAEDPSIVIVNGICFILNFRWTLYEYVVVIQHHLLNFAVFHQGIFVEQSGLTYFVPVYLINSMLIRQGYYAFILVVITVNTEFYKAVVTISACYCHSLRLENVQSEQTRIEVQKENVIKVYLGIHDPQGIQIQESSVNHSQRLDFGWILHRDQKDFHICVVTVIIINSITEVASQQIGKSSGFSMCKFQQLPSFDLAVANVHIIFYLFLDGVVSQIHNVPVIGIGGKHFSSLFGTVHHSQPMIEEKSSIEATHITFGCHFDWTIDVWQFLFLSDQAIDQMSCIWIVFVEDESFIAHCVAFFLDEVGNYCWEMLLFSIYYRGLPSHRGHLAPLFQSYVQIVPRKDRLEVVVDWLLEGEGEFFVDGLAEAVGDGGSGSCVRLHGHEGDEKSQYEVQLGSHKYLIC